MRALAPTAREPGEAWLTHTPAPGGHRPDTAVFLFNFSTRELHGVFRPVEQNRPSDATLPSFPVSPVLENCPERVPQAAGVPQHGADLTRCVIQVRGACVFDTAHSASPCRRPLHPPALNISSDAWRGPRPGSRSAVLARTRAQCARALAAELP